MVRTYITYIFHLQVLAASKNKISTLKGFPYLPSLEVSNEHLVNLRLLLNVFVNDDIMFLFGRGVIFIVVRSGGKWVCAQCMFLIRQTIQRSCNIRNF